MRTRAVNYPQQSRQDKSAEKEFYNKQAEKEAIKEAYQIKHHKHMLSSALSCVSGLIEKMGTVNLRVFEVGSSGDFCRALKDKYPDKDISATLGDIAFQQLIESEIYGNKVNLDLEFLPFKDGVFDFIFLRGVLHHFPKLDFCTRELMRVCSKAIIITNEPCGDNPVVLISRWTSRILSKFIKVSTTVNETMHRMRTYKSNFYNYGAKKIVVENGDEIFSDKESWDSFLSNIKQIDKIYLLPLLLIRVYLLRILAILFSKYPFGWNTFFILIAR